MQGGRGFGHDSAMPERRRSRVAQRVLNGRWALLLLLAARLAVASVPPVPAKAPPAARPVLQSLEQSEVLKFDSGGVVIPGDRWNDSIRPIVVFFESSQGSETALIKLENRVHRLALKSRVAESHGGIDSLSYRWSGDGIEVRAKLRFFEQTEGSANWRGTLSVHVLGASSSLRVFMSFCDECS